MGKETFFGANNKGESHKLFKFNTLDYILVKGIGNTWEVFQYSRETELYYIMVGGMWIAKCNCEVLPYNDNSKHLLGTK